MELAHGPAAPLGNVSRDEDFVYCVPHGVLDFSSVYDFFFFFAFTAVCKLSVFFFFCFFELSYFNHLLSFLFFPEGLRAGDKQMLRRSVACYIFATGVARKRAGKPADTPDYKQVYLPYDTPPTKMELERERKKLQHAYHGRMESRKLVEVKEVPLNVYTYGKEGMSLPISIFKEQQDPVIGPEWTYPGIYENKVAAQHWYIEELFEKESRNDFESPWQRQVLDNQVKRRMANVSFRFRQLNMKAVDLFQKERGSAKRGAGGAEKGKDAPAKR